MFLEQSRHNFMIFLLVIFIFMGFATTTHWKEFVVISFLTGILLLIDLIFLNQPEFSTSPSYDHWKNLEEAGLHKYDSDISAKNKKMVFNN